MSKIEIVTFNQCDDMEFDSLDNKFVRYMGTLESTDVRMNFLATCTCQFSKVDANKCMLKELEEMKEDAYSMATLDVEDINEFISELQDEEE